MAWFVAKITFVEAVMKLVRARHPPGVAEAFKAKVWHLV